MIFDSHCHTEISADSEMKAEEALEAAQRLGIGLVFTEHMDLDYPGELDFTFDPKQYWQKYEPLRGDGLRLGVELGLESGLEERLRKISTQVPFDQVIGAIHMLWRKDIYYAESYEGQGDKAEVFRFYLQTMAQLVRSCEFVDVLAHIDYICRYCPFEDKELRYVEFADEIDVVLRAVIETGKVMELNTRRIGNPVALKNLAPIYARYRELGGKYITIGSDAHNTGALGCNFVAALDLAEQLKLSIVTFKERKMEILHHI